jgi:hypothetical protein
MRYELIGIKEHSRMKIDVSALSPKVAIAKGALMYPGYKFFTTKTGEWNTATLLMLLNIHAVKIKVNL